MRRLVPLRRGVARWFAGVDGLSQQDRNVRNLVIDTAWQGLTTFVLRFGLNLPAALYSIYWIRRLDASDLWIGCRLPRESWH